MNKPLTINIKKKTSSIEDMYRVYISIIESVSSLRFPEQEKIALIEILKEREITKNVKDILAVKIGVSSENVLTRLRKKGVIKNNKIHPSFQEFKNGAVTFNIALTNG